MQGFLSPVYIPFQPVCVVSIAAVRVVLIASRIQRQANLWILKSFALFAFEKF